MHKVTQCCYSSHSLRPLALNKLSAFRLSTQQIPGPELYTLPTPLVQKVWTFIKTHRHFSVGCRLASTDQNMLASHPTNGLFLFSSFCWLLFFCESWVKSFLVVHRLNYTIDKTVMLFGTMVARCQKCEIHCYAKATTCSTWTCA